MRILVVHNDYGKYSGEEAVVDRMIADGRRNGYVIETLRRSSHNSRESFWGKTHGFFSGIYSFSGRRLMRRALYNFQPDVVHIHNLYPFISPAVLPLCRRKGVPVVMTVHNYRLICPTGLFLRDGRPCENCLVKGNEWDCVRYNCEHSRPRSLGYALRNWVARKTKAYKDCVDYFCCLTEFQKQKLMAAGFDSKKIAVFPNSVKYIEPSKDQLPDNARDFIGYVGRLSEEKGYDMLFEVARRHPEMEFRFAGALRDNTLTEVPSNVKLYGQLSKEELARFYTEARFIVIPSRCYEGFPVVLLEAASHSKACIAPNHGAFPDLMYNSEMLQLGGLLFKPLDIDDMEQKVYELWHNPEKAKELGRYAESNYKQRFQQDMIADAWDVFYRQIVKNPKITPINR